MASGWTQSGSGLSERHCAAPPRPIGRTDGSAAMLEQQPKVETLLQDLEHGLPVLTQPPLLLASSFCLHWLGTLCLQRWAALRRGACWLWPCLWQGAPAVAQAGAAGVPAQRCRSRIQISCCRPGSHTVLVDQRLLFTQHGVEPSALLRGFAAIGANATQQPLWWRGHATVAQGLATGQVAPAGQPHLSLQLLLVRR